MSEHYFSAEPSSSAKSHTVDFTVQGRGYSLSAASGVFSAVRLDTGTGVLLRKADLPGEDTEGVLLDLGCGYGPIATVLATRAPKAVVWAVDINARARELAEQNAKGLNITVESPEGIPEEVKFDQIWSNPPIRIGKEGLHELLLKWLPRLKPDGVAWLVVAKHLGSDSLQKWLTDRGWPAVKHASGAGYRILKVSRTDPS